MKPTKSLSRCWLIIATLTLIAGCAKEPAPAPESAVLDEPQQLTIMKFTSGRVDVSALRVSDATQVEVIAMREMTPELKALLAKQHELYVASLLPVVEEGATPVEGLDLLDEKDVEALQEKLEELKAAYPPRLVSSYTIGIESKEYESRASLQKRYAADVAAINLENMVPVITGIADKMRDDYTLLQNEETAHVGTERGIQAKADINWLSRFVDYMEQYKGIMSRYDTLRLRALKKRARAEEQGKVALNPQSALAEFQYNNAMILQVNVYKFSQGSTFPQADGSFKVEGQGELLLRVEDKNGNAIFFGPVMAPPTVKFLDIELTTLTVMPQDDV